MSPASYRAVLFDLFGTLLTVSPERLGELTIGPARVRSTLGSLTPAVRRWIPDATPEALWAALATATRELGIERGPEHREFPSRERFRRALHGLGVDASSASEAAVHLSRAHLGRLAAATDVPESHRALLAAVASRYRVALVSNFDDTATVLTILRAHGIERHLPVVVVSETVGVRKPNPAIVRVALAELDVAPGEALLVGDTFAEDVIGAHAAGVDAAWIDAGGAGVPPGASPPRHVVRALPEMAAILGVG
ncbi:MAG: HAD family hydrolase [Candidatus Binatia bacterium]